MLLTEIFDRPALAKMRKLDGITGDMLSKNVDLVKTVLANRLTLAQAEELMGKLNGTDQGSDETEFQMKMLEKLVPTIIPGSRTSRQVGGIANKYNTNILHVYRRLPNDSAGITHSIEANFGFVGTWAMEASFHDNVDKKVAGSLIYDAEPTTYSKGRFATPEEAADALQRFYTRILKKPEYELKKHLKLEK